MSGSKSSLPIAVPIVAGTAIKGLAANVMMRGVMERHPQRLPRDSAKLRRHAAVDSIPATHCRRHPQGPRRPGATTGLPARPGRPFTGRPRGIALRHRQSETGQARLLHRLPLARVSQRGILVEPRGEGDGPQLRSGTTRHGSQFLEFLTRLHADIPSIADRVTNIYSTHEIFIRPYVSAHIDVPGVSNVLIATKDEYAKHLRTFPDLPVDELVLGRVTHAGEMNTPEVRSLVWRKVDDLTAEIRLNRPQSNTRQPGTRRTPPVQRSGSGESATASAR